MSYEVASLYGRQLVNTQALTASLSRLYLRDEKRKTMQDTPGSYRHAGTHTLYHYVYVVNGFINELAQFNRVELANTNGVGVRTLN
jgi:hypothetical protein